MADQAVWKGLFEWSMKHHDGTTAPRPMPEGERQFLEDAMKSAMIDLGKRMTDIKDTLDTAGAVESGGGGGDEAAAEGSGEAASPPATLEQRERLLDELQDIVDQIDLAKDLHTIGGLQTLLDLMRSPHPSLRWRAAEVAATCAQNNPPVQTSFMEEGIMPHLLQLLDDPHSMVQTKGLMAISCMVRGYPPAMLALRELGGLIRLVALLGEPEPRLQRKCLQVLQYMLRVVPLARRPAASDTRLLPMLISAMESEDNDVREAALAVGQQLAADNDSLRVVQQHSGFCSALEALQMRLDTLPQDEWASVQEEVESVKSLATTMQRELPPPLDGSDTEQHNAPPAAVVDDSDTTGAPHAALQLMAVPAAAAPVAGESQRS